MTFEATIKAILVGDGTLTATLVGGLYAYGETGRLGISRSSTPGAYLNGFLQPTALVKARDQLPAGGILDADQQFASVRQVVEIWLYNDGDKGYADLETARERVYALLQFTALSGGGEANWVMDIDNVRDSDLNNAAVLRSDWVVYAIRQTS